MILDFWKRTLAFCSVFIFGFYVQILFDRFFPARRGASSARPAAAVTDEMTREVMQHVP